MNTPNDKIICLVDSAHGIYIPQTFAEQVSGAGAENSLAWNLPPGDIRILLSGPETPDYWKTWDNVLQNAKRRLSNGDTYTLHHDNDLFAVLEGWCLECNQHDETCTC